MAGRSALDHLDRQHSGFIRGESKFFHFRIHRTLACLSLNMRAAAGVFHGNSLSYRVRQRLRGQSVPLK